MPADYNSTAKALALPISPLGSPSPEDQSNRPPWSRRISAGTRRSNNSPYAQNTSLSYKNQILRSADKVQRQVLATFKKLTPLQKILAIAALIGSVIFGILFLVYNEKIFGALAPAAKKWRHVNGGWMILWLLTFISAFPPLIGYSTTVTISGFVYGFPNGWFIVASATVVGSLASFLASRTILSKYVHKLVGKDKRFEALALTLKHDGLKILCMIRFCPLPYSLSNAAMSTFPTVHPLSFALATLIASPKLLIHVFIGSRMAAIGEDQKMDTSTKIINWTSIIVGGVLGAGVGYFIYQKTISRAKELEIEELEAGRGDLPRERTYSDETILEEDLDTDAAALMDSDDISLWDNNDENTGYRDEFSDADEDVFARGDVDETTFKGKGNPRR